MKKDILPDGELNPGLPRDRRGYWPLYYRGLVESEMLLQKIFFQPVQARKCRVPWRRREINH